jgi:hypothetical protein
MVGSILGSAVSSPKASHVVADVIITNKIDEQKRTYDDDRALFSDPRRTTRPDSCRRWFNPTFSTDELILAKDDLERRVMMNIVGSVCDGDEVWLLTAGGAPFAALAPLMRHGLQWSLPRPLLTALGTDLSRHGL